MLFSTGERNGQLDEFPVCFVKIGSLLVAQAGLTFTILLSRLAKHWSYRHVPPCLACGWLLSHLSFRKGILLYLGENNEQRGGIKRTRKISKLDSDAFFPPLRETKRLVLLGGPCREQEALEPEGRAASSCGFQGSFFLAPPLLLLSPVFPFQLLILGETWRDTSTSVVPGWDITPHHLCGPSR